MPKRIRKSFKIHSIPKDKRHSSTFTNDELDWFENELRKIAIEKFQLKDNALYSDAKS